MKKTALTKEDPSLTMAHEKTMKILTGNLCRRIANNVLEWLSLRNSICPWPRMLCRKIPSKAWSGLKSKAAGRAWLLGWLIHICKTVSPGDLSIPSWP